MAFPFGVTESVFNFKERLWHETFISERLACFSMNVVLFFFIYQWQRWFLQLRQCYHSCLVNKGRKECLRNSPWWWRGGGGPILGPWDILLSSGLPCESQDRNLRQKCMNVWAENCLGHNAGDVCVCAFLACRFWLPCVQGLGSSFKFL